ncbi:4526_t:CDS:2, partial [Racocetra fulgida]
KSSLNILKFSSIYTAHIANTFCIDSYLKYIFLMANRSIIQGQQLELYLKERGIKSFDFSQCEKQIIGSGGFAIVYSVTFKGTKYALKSLNNNLHFDRETFNKFKREVGI